MVPEAVHGQQTRDDNRRKTPGARAGTAVGPELPALPRGLRMQRPAAPAMGSTVPPAAAAADEDRGLVDRAQAGDAGAFETLVRRYQGWVFTLALRMLGDRAEAEDLAQEIFLKAYRGLKGFKGASRFSTWLYSITSHHCLNHLKARRRQLQHLGRGGDRPGAVGNDPPAPVDRLADEAPRADVLLERA